MISLIQWFFSSSVLILVVLVLRGLLAKKLSLRLRYALWGIVLLRLLLPLSPLPNAISLAPLTQPLQTQAEEKMFYAVPTRTYELSTNYKTPHYTRTEHSFINFGTRSYTYQSGGSVRYENQRTDYFFLMPMDELLTVIWKIGALLLALRLLYINYFFRDFLKENRNPYPVPDSPLSVYLVEEGLPSPCLVGVLNLPAIYLTPEAVQDEDTLRHVMAHELTHFAHSDHMWSALRCLCLVLHWYNPLVWLACILSRRDGELACDEGAVERLGEGERLRYGRTLVGMVARRSLRPGDLLTCSTAMAEGKKPIQQRIQLLVKQPKTAKAARLAVICVTLLSLLLVFSTQTNPKHLEFATYEQFLNEIDLSQRWSLSSRDGKIDSTLDLPEAVHAEIMTLLSAGTSVHRWVDQENYHKLNPSSFSFSRIPTGLYLYEMEDGCHLVEHIYFHGDDLDSYFHYNQIKYHYYHLATLPSGTADTLFDLMEQATQPVLTILSQEELDFFNNGEFFDNGTRNPGASGKMNIRNQFLSSFYDNPRDIDLFDLFYCGSGQNDRSIAETQQILNAIIDSGAFYPETGCTTLTTAEINDVLNEHIGLTLEQTNKVGLEHMDYLPSHDVYYHFHGDTNYGSAPYFTGGKRLGDTIELYYQDTFGLLGYIPCVLTLIQTGEDEYRFYSNQPMYKDPAIALSVPNTGNPSADMQIFAEELRMRYIFLNEHHPRSVSEITLRNFEIYSQSDTQLFVHLSFAIDPNIQNIYGWTTERGLLKIKEGPHAGLYDFTLNYLLELQENNVWTCTSATNRLPNPQ